MNSFAEWSLLRLLAPFFLGIALEVLAFKIGNLPDFPRGEFGNNFQLILILSGPWAFVISGFIIYKNRNVRVFFYILGVILSLLSLFGYVVFHIKI